MAIRTAPRRHGARREPPRESPPKPEKRKGFVRRFWWLLLPALILIGMAGTLVYAYIKIELPEAPPPALTTYLYDRDGKLITTLHAEIDRTEISLKRMPEHLRQAVIAMEDRGFYDHPGVSVFGIIRAAWADFRNRSIEQGGSTITQQYVKTVYTGGERTVLRKIKEAILALKLENKYSKDEILEKYLNTIYFGRGAYGVEAAAETYFGKHAKDLNVVQSATLAGVIAAPEKFNPIVDPGAAKIRRDEALDAMVEEGYLARSDAERYKDRGVNVIEPGSAAQTGPAAYFADYTRRFLQDEFGYETTFTGGLRVKTTLDLELQRAAEGAVSNHLSNPGDPNAALVSIDPRTGDIVAMVGGKNFKKAKFNLATQAKRQAGSSFKTFTLAAAMEDHISPFSTWQGPGSITIDDPRCEGPDGEKWSPSNYSDSSSGTLSLVGATAGSVNTVFAQLVTQVDPSDVAEIAHRLGIRSRLRPFCSITLGTQEVTPFEMTSAYATIAAQGVYREPRPVTEVSAAGYKKVVFKPTRERAIRQNDADLVIYMEKNVVTGGTGTNARLASGMPVFGKTGTSEENADAWFCGATKQLATCVWVGYKAGRVPMHDIGGYSSVTGGSIPALIWHDFMTVAMQGMPIVDWPEPSFDGYNVGAFGHPYEPTTIPPQPTPKPKPKPKPKHSPKPPPSPSVEPSPTVTVTPTESPSTD
ncbi:MAG TPA: PBP1A family penicillin-binding protein [Actinomycetota bacterium]|nr:PBP1A family penicillin-binding protein [Actinomycetota bacterium]